MPEPQTDLAEMQTAFGEALFGDSPKAALHWISDDDGLAKNRLLIYRKNAQTSLLECMRRRYPRVRTSLGGADFDEIARDFVCSHPPVDEALINYGAGFSEFLDRSRLEEGARSKIAPWLPDLAKLELYWHQSYHARDQASLGAADLAGYDPSRLGSLCFETHPTLRTLSSQYDLLQAWENRAQSPARKPCVLLVVRPDETPMLYRLEGDFEKVFSCLASGGTSAQAFELATNASEFSRWLAMLLSWAYSLDFAKGEASFHGIRFENRTSDSDFSEAV